MDLNYYTPNISSGYSGSMVWTIISIVLAIIGGIAAYVLFLNKKDKVTNKKLAWIKDFFNFKHLILEQILKISYVILTIFITLTSFNLIGNNFGGFLFQLIVGNILLRLIYEGALIAIMIWKNTTEINKKLK